MSAEINPTNYGCSGPHHCTIRRTAPDLQISFRSGDCNLLARFLVSWAGWAE